MNAKLLLPALLLAAACSDVEDPDTHHDHNHDLVTTMLLRFTPARGDALEFVWSDPELDGSPEKDDILLPDASDHDHHDAKSYTLEVELWNSHDEDMTTEIQGLAEEHQIFFTGAAVEGPATGDNPDALLEHAYLDEDAGGLPVGLENEVTTLGWGTQELTVSLRHLPPENGTAVKTEGLADDVASGGLSAIGGGNDIQVTFSVTVE